MKLFLRELELENFILQVKILGSVKNLSNNKSLLSYW